MNLGPTELMIVLVIILVIFGGTKLPKLARSLGEARKEFEQANDEVDKTKTPPVVTAASETDLRVAAAESDAEVARREADLLRREAEVRGRETN